jgi:predicted  nucleic acid-binding Zn-ribbon protein
MSTTDLVKQLHDKTTRGGTLSIVEQAQLEAWYAQQDQEESVLLARTSSSSLALSTLQTQVDTAIAQMLAVTQHLQELEKYNETLRREITTLQQQLQRSAPVQSA